MTEAEEALGRLVGAARDLGWDVLATENHDDGEIAGLCVGRPEYVAWIMQHIPDKYTGRPQ